jgi:hypothetical protein
MSESGLELLLDEWLSFIVGACRVSPEASGQPPDQNIQQDLLFHGFIAMHPN